MRILIIADPMLPIPPRHYGGVERIIDLLCRGLQSTGHEVGLVAHAASSTSGELFALPCVSPVRRSDLVRNGLAVWRAARSFRPDAIQNFGRLAFLWPMLRWRTGKVMSYQREPTLNRVRQSAALG